MVPSVINSNYVSVVFGGKAYSFAKESPHFSEVKKAVQSGNLRNIQRAVDAAAVMAKQTHGKVTIVKGGVKVNGKFVNTALSQRIQALYEANKPVSHILKFMDNLYRNPSTVAQEELFQFLEKCSLPITDDGCFVAYKVVDEDFRDCYTHSIDNQVGSVVSMPRSKVNPNRHETCSQGLHFCSKAYVKSYPGDHVIAVKVNPKDVVAIPADYENSKGRCWKYEVIAQLGAWSEGYDGHALLESSALLPVKQDRKELLAVVLGRADVKRWIRSGKVKQANLRKMSFGRLKAFAAKLPATEARKQSPVIGNHLREMRQAVGVTLTGIAKRLNMSKDAVRNLERREATEKDVDKYHVALNLESNKRHIVVTSI